MKYFLREVKIVDGEETFTETEKSTLFAAQTLKKGSNKIHICRHEEGLPCTLE